MTDLPTDWKGAAKALVFTAAGLGLPLAKKLIDVACDLAGGALIKDSYWYVNRGGYRDRVNAADSPATEGRLNVVTMQLPDGSGDGTVPESSARALKLPSDTRRTFCVGDKGSYKAGLEKIKSIDAPDFDEAFFDRAHEPIFKSASAHHITFTAIENICRKEIKRRLGTNG